MIEALMIPLFLIINFCTYVFGISDIYRLSLMFVISIFGYSRFLLKFSGRVLRTDFRILVSILFFISCGLLSRLMNGNITTGNLTATIFYIGMALHMSFVNPKTWATKIAFYFNVLYFLLLLLTGVNSREVMVGVSRNFISVITIFNYIILLISSGNRISKIQSLLYAIIIFFICVWGYGRSGVIAGIIILLGNYVYFLSGRDTKRIRPGRVVMIVFSLVSILIMIWIFNPNILIYTFDSFTSKGLDTPRMSFYIEYLDRVFTKIGYIVFGAPMDGLIIDRIFEGNFHNSYLQLHAFFGLIPTISIIIAIMGTFKTMIKNKEILFLVAFISIISRSLSDRVFFSGYSELVLYYFLLVFFYNRHQIINTTRKEVIL